MCVCVLVKPLRHGAVACCQFKKEFFPLQRSLVRADHRNLLRRSQAGALWKRILDAQTQTHIYTRIYTHFLSIFEKLYHRLQLRSHMEKFSWKAKPPTPDSDACKPDGVISSIPYCLWACYSNHPQTWGLFEIKLHSVQRLIAGKSKEAAILTVWPITLISIPHSHTPKQFILSGKAFSPNWQAVRQSKCCKASACLTLRCNDKTTFAECGSLRHFFHHHGTPSEERPYWVPRISCYAAKVIANNSCIL